MDPKLNELLKWSVANSAASTSDATSAPPPTTLNPEAIQALFGGPSDADLMLASMQAIQSTDPEITLDDKLIAFDNFEQLIENLDNANNLGPLSLWTPLLELLSHDEKELRRMAAWCVGTAVQNNEKSQERLLAMGGVEKLVGLATREGEGREVRRKAVYALSSAGRNYQPAMDVITQTLGKDKVDAGDMDEVDGVIGGLREDAMKAAP